MDLVKETLQHLHLGPETTFERLTMYPLLNGGGHAPDYLMLRQAIGNGTLRITEVSEGGSVPSLSVANEGAQPVLIIDGEELVGAKQQPAGDFFGTTARPSPVGSRVERGPVRH